MSAQPKEREFLITWAINGEGATARKAAERIWREVFGRSAAGPDDACIFEVQDLETDETVTIDLSEED